MTTTKARLLQLEKRRPVKSARMFTYYEGDEYGNLSGPSIEGVQKVRVADFKAGPQDTVFRVVYDDITDRPETTITGPDGYQETVGIDAGKL